MRHPRILGLLLVGLAASLLIVVGAALAALPPGGTFTDDNGNIHEGNIEAIAAEGITKGCNPPANDRYCPSTSLSRGQMAAFVRRALSLPSASTDYFVDDDGSVFEGDINALAEAGITKGCNPPTSDRYCPDGSITREQMAAFLRRAFDYPAAPIDYFTDDDDSIFEADINAIAQAKVTLGCNPPSNTLYCPKNLVKRDQMASFFARALGLAPIYPTTTTTTTTIPTRDITWSCEWNDFLSKYDCSGNVDKADPANETWRCSFDGDDDWDCVGNIYKSSLGPESWSSYEIAGSNTVLYFGNVVPSTSVSRSWSCAESGYAASCRGEVDPLDRIEENWACTWDDSTATRSCSGQIDKSSTDVEMWSCTLNRATGSWNCAGDNKREVMLTPNSEPLTLP